MIKMKNLFCVILLLVMFPLMGMAQMEVEYSDDADIALTDSAMMRHFGDFEKMSLDSLIEEGVLDIDKDNDPVYKPGMTYAEYGRAMDEYTKKELEKQLGGYQIQALTGNVDEDRAKFEELCRVLFSNSKLRIETPLTAFMMMFRDKSNPGSLGEAEMFSPYLFQIIFSSWMEYHIYAGLGGSNPETWQILSALMSGGVGEGFREKFKTEPDVYSEKVDSVISFINRLDYIGDIYPTESLLPRETQDSLVALATDAMKDLKVGIHRQYDINNSFQDLMTQLYAGKDLALENYFTQEMSEKIRSKKVKLSTISPDKKWKDWDVKTCCSLLHFNDSYMVMLTAKPWEVMQDEGLSEKTYKKSIKHFYLTFSFDDGKVLISDFMSDEEYYKKHEEDFHIPDFMPDPGTDVMEEDK